MVAWNRFDLNVFVSKNRLILWLFQVFHVTVVARATGEVHFNETTRKLDLFVQNLIEGTSYLTTVTPMNKKGVGKSTHVIVDTMRHPAVELTKAEAGTRGGKKGSSGSANGLDGKGSKAEDDWAVLMGMLVGGVGGLTVLVVASLVIRFCFCPRRPPGSGLNYAKSDLPDTPMPPAPEPFDAMSEAILAGEAGNMEPIEIALKPTSFRKGILKRSSADSLDDGFMIAEHGPILPPPPFPGKSHPRGTTAQSSLLLSITVGTTWPYIDL